MQKLKEILAVSTPLLASAALATLGGCNKADTPAPPAPAAQNAPPATAPAAQPIAAPIATAPATAPVAATAPATQLRDAGPMIIAGRRP